MPTCLAILHMYAGRLCGRFGGIEFHTAKSTSFSHSSTSTSSLTTSLKILLYSREYFCETSPSAVSARANNKSSIWLSSILLLSVKLTSRVLSFLYIVDVFFGICHASRFLQLKILKRMRLAPSSRAKRTVPFCYSLRQIPRVSK